MKTRDVTYQIIQNELHRVMKDWMYCDHLLDFKSWKHSDPKPIPGISYVTVTRHLRMLRRRIEGLMGKSARRKEPSWPEVSSCQWDLLWTGEEALRKYGTILWETGHKSITLFPGALGGPIHKVIRQSGDGIQTKNTQVPHPKRIPTWARNTPSIPKSSRLGTSTRRGFPGGHSGLVYLVRGLRISFTNHRIK